MDIPIVLLPREGQSVELERCRAAGCDSVILNPINRHHLIETATTILKIKIRAVPRIKTRLQIHFGPGEKDMLREFTFNLSTGGVFIETKEIHPKDTPLVVVFELPELKDGVSCKARVAWINPPGEIVNPLLPPGMGIEFLDLSLMDLEAIFALVKKEFFSPSW